MATPRTPNQKKQYAQLNLRLAKYGKLVEQLYEKFNREAAKIVMRTDYDPDAGKMFHFQDFPQTRDAVQKLLSEYMSDMTGTINRTTSIEWENSNEFQDLVANKVLKAYGVKAKDGTEYERYFQVNSDHLKAFQTRTVNGMNLSRRVWNLKEQYKQELEMGLSVGIEKGVSAASLAKQMKQYLNEPDKLFRRVRDKFGNLELSKNAKAYHPGRGVYRSSFKNAMRLTRSETNMAYRTAEQTRWRQFDFVVGYEIKLSQSHPCEDVCDTLAGKYPKDFVWTGWHPMDLCYCVSILKTQDEFWRDLGEENPGKSENEVTDVPEAFKNWVKDNEERIETAEKRGTQPYFIRDNKEYIQGILKPSDSESDANNSNAPQEVKKTPQEIAAERHAARTQEEIDTIRENWSNRKVNQLWDAINNGYLPSECADKIAEIKDDITFGDFDEFNRKAKVLDSAITRHKNRTESQIDRVQSNWNTNRLNHLIELSERIGSYRDVSFRDLAGLLDNEISVKDLNGFKSDYQIAKKYVVDKINEQTSWAIALRDNPEFKPTLDALEKAFGKIGKPMTYFEANVGRENPLYDTSVGYKENCQTCTMTHWLRRLGFDVTAKPNDKIAGSRDGTIYKELDRLGINWKDRFRNLDSSKVNYNFTSSWKISKGYKIMTEKHIEEYLKERLSSDGLYEIYCGWKGGNAHVFCAEVYNGNIRYFDPQSGRDNVEYYIKSMKGDAIGVIRIDNKKIDSKLVGLFNLVKK